MNEIEYPVHSIFITINNFLTLTLLIFWIFLVNHEKFTFTTNNLAISATFFN